MSPKHCLKLGRWQVLPHINKVKQCLTVFCPLKSVCLFSLFSHENKERPFIYFV